MAFKLFTRVQGAYKQSARVRQNVFTNVCNSRIKLTCCICGGQSIGSLYQAGRYKGVGRKGICCRSIFARYHRGCNRCIGNRCHYFEHIFPVSSIRVRDAYSVADVARYPRAADRRRNYGLPNSPPPSSKMGSMGCFGTWGCMFVLAATSGDTRTRTLRRFSKT